MKIFLKSKSLIILPAFLVVLFSLWLIWPMDKVFQVPNSQLVFDTHQRLMWASLAKDEQYRFPPDSLVLPQKYIRALLSYEDQRFYDHPGVDPLALIQAAWTNLKSGNRLRGGSTITMQIARLANPKPRTYINKLFECLVALKIDLHLSKEEILKLYAANVPMGGNIVGIQSASYYYYGKPVQEITWAEAALFSVIPNAPSLMNLKKRRPELIAKRNQLLQKLYNKGHIDSTTFRLACLEFLPEKENNLPFIAPHFTRWVLEQDSKEHRITTTVDINIQRQVENAAKLHFDYLSNQGIRNLSVLVAESHSGKIRAYLGSQNFYDSLNSGQVDGIRAYRSTGSVLKTFLTAKVLDRGPYTMISKIQDVPTFYGTFVPQNADKHYAGLVSLKNMLIRSKNVPFVRLLNAYGVNDFYDFLKEAGLKGLFRSAGDYGLSLILGGAEASLFEVVRLYLSIGQMGKSASLRWNEKAGPDDRPIRSTQLYSEGSAWLVLKTLQELSRPGIESYTHLFSNRIPVSWKTGTSYGHRDAWAIGVNKQWTIGVWVGNFDGEGNAALSGVQSAAPLLFSLFNSLSKKELLLDFEEPEYDLIFKECCNESGYPAGPSCPEISHIQVPRAAFTPGTCPYHQRFLTDQKSGREICSLCWKGLIQQWEIRFILPPLVQEIMQKNGYTVDRIPKHSSNCLYATKTQRIQLLYPVNGIRIFIPRDLDGKYEKIVFSAKHQRPESHLFWYLNSKLIGETRGEHTLLLDLDPGNYQLTVQDEIGYTIKVNFSAYKNENFALTD